MFSSCRHRDAAARCHNNNTVPADSWMSAVEIGVSTPTSEVQQQQHPYWMKMDQRHSSTSTLYQPHQYHVQRQQLTDNELASLHEPCSEHHQHRHHYEGQYHHHQQQQQQFSAADSAAVIEMPCNGQYVTDNYTLINSRPIHQDCHKLQCDQYLAMMTSQNVTSSEYNWEPCGTVESNHCDVETDFDLPAGSRYVSTPQFRSRDLLCDKMASFVRRVREAERSGSGSMASAVCAAYERWTAAVEAERGWTRCRVHSDSKETLMDDIHSRLIDILDSALQYPPSAAPFLATALSRTALDVPPVACRWTVSDIQTVLHRVRQSQVVVGDFADGRQVDDQIAALLVKSASDNKIEDDDRMVDRSTGWTSAAVNQMYRQDVVTNRQPCVQWSLDSAMFPAAEFQPLPDQVTSVIVEVVSSSAAVPGRRVRRTRQPHTRTAVDLLKAWYDEHRSQPYASDIEVRRLAADCQLSVRQVQKWLSNRRRMDGNTRRRSRPAHNAKSSTSLPVQHSSSWCNIP